jgi:glycosyltransferase involved in cell wall biosynthesis
MKTFSIIVPTCQNRSNLDTTVPRLLALADQLPEYRLELTFVDDGSTDGSREYLEQIAKQYPDRIQVVLLTRNFGQTPATQAGIRHASGDCIGIISCDLQEPCEKFVEMVRLWEQGHKYILGERVERRENAIHRAGSSIYWLIVRHFAFPDFPRMGYDFCVFDRQIAHEINAINEKNTSIFVLIYWLGHRPYRLPIVRELRSQGQSQWNLRRKIGFTVDTLIGFTYVPARTISALGLCTSVAAMVYLVVVFLRWTVLKAPTPGWMTVVGLVTVLGALNLFAVGILSEYLVRILEEARKRPPYIVDRVINPPSRPGGV